MKEISKDPNNFYNQWAKKAIKKMMYLDIVDY